MAVDGPGIRTCFEVAEEADQEEAGHRRGPAAPPQQGLPGGDEAHPGRRHRRRRRRARASGCSATCGSSRGSRPGPTPSGRSATGCTSPGCRATTSSSSTSTTSTCVQWAIGKPPVAAVGMGGRQQRIDPAFGHIYDHFAVDFEYPDGVHVLSMARQIPGCHNDISEHVIGTKGRVDLANAKWSLGPWRKNPTWTYESTQGHRPLRAGAHRSHHLDPQGQALQRAEGRPPRATWPPSWAACPPTPASA